MNTETQRINILISNHLFESDDGRNVFRESIGKTLPPILKKEVLDYYHQQNSYRRDKISQNTSINDRDVAIINVLPNLAQDQNFFEKMNRHAKNFCKTFMERADSNEIYLAQPMLKPIKTLMDAGKFFESILYKKQSNQPITNNEKVLFKLLITGIFKMDKSLDAENSKIILKLLTKYFHYDKSGQESELYSCILSQGSHLARVVSDLWNVELMPEPYSFYNNKIPDFSDSQLLEDIANLDSIDERMEKSLAFEKIKNELQSRKTLNQQDNFKENLLKVIIESNQPELLEILINRADFDINQVKINGETPLIYTLQTVAYQGGESIIKALIKNNPNTPGLEGKTPLQIAIDCYRKLPVKDSFYSDNHSYSRIISLLLRCHNLCVDSEDSTGLTALCYFALFPKIDSKSLSFVKELIRIGANIDHPIPGYGTVRTLLEDKLNRDQFADLEKLANNL